MTQCSRHRQRKCATGNWRWLLASVGLLAVPPLSIAATGTVYTTTAEPAAGVGLMPSTATLWIPDNTPVLRAVWGISVGKVGVAAMCEDPQATQYAAHMGMALYCSRIYKNTTKASNDPYDGSGEMILRHLDQFAVETGHPELRTAPLVITGYSGGAYNADQWCYFRPDRLLAVIPERGGFDNQDNVDGVWYPYKIWLRASRIPALYIPGGSDGIVPYTGVSPTFVKLRSIGGLKTFYLQPGGTHMNMPSLSLEAGWLGAVAELRLSNRPGETGKAAAMATPVDSTGWLGDNVTKQISPFAGFAGNRATASWLPNEAVANMWMGAQACSEESMAPLEIRGPRAAFRPAPLPAQPGSALPPPGGTRRRVVVSGRRVLTDDGSILRGCTVSPFTLRDTGWWNRLRSVGHFNAVRYAAWTGPWSHTSGSDMTIDRQLALLDEAVADANAAGVYMMISNYSNCCGDYDTQRATGFWEAVAPRYKECTNVLYEIQNDPVAWSPPYDSAAVAFQANMHTLIRRLAPQTHIVCWSFSSAVTGITEEAGKVREIPYTNESIGFQPYRYSETNVAMTRVRYPMIATEVDAGSVDRLSPMIRAFERIGIGWFWAGTDVDDGTLADSGVFWPGENTAAAPLHAWPQGSVDGGVRPVWCASNGRGPDPRARGWQVFDPRGREVRLGQHRLPNARVFIVRARRRPVAPEYPGSP